MITEIETATSLYISSNENPGIIRSYRIQVPITEEAAETFAEAYLMDCVTDTLSFEIDTEGVEVRFKRGVTDNEGKIAQDALEAFLGKKLPFGSVASSFIYLDQKEKEIGNPLIHDFFQHQKKGSLFEISEKRQLPFTREETEAIEQFFKDPDFLNTRKEFGLSSWITDVELEALAQTWSEHCKHKIFNAEITYIEENQSETIDSIFSTYIKHTTEELQPKKPFLLSVFSDNAGIVKFTDEWSLAFKVETHNSPSALDPYGGSLTGILGAMRDVMGAGLGARLVANTNILCFAPPDYSGPLPSKLKPPKQVMAGVCLGIEHGGNKMGVPTVNGSLLFDDRFAGKPLVFCGSVGILPSEIMGTPSYHKPLSAGDAIIIVGGRTGKDGLHGATFSSEALHDESPTSAVQIGDPFTQKKVHDFLLEARDEGLYKTLTDNGAGGFSSSCGELAELSNGCELHLEKAPLKADRLLPWEILLSESQERMTLAVAPEKIEPLLQLADKHGVETAHLGSFTQTGLFHVLFEGKTVACLPLNFLHHGLPKMRLKAEWKAPATSPFPRFKGDYTEALKQVLGRFNVCSKEPIVRRYDHEVQGGSALKPFVGVNHDGPSDAAVVCPLETLKKENYQGIVLSHGICPKFSDFDTYHMAILAVCEAVANGVAVGGDPASFSVLDNFCWPDPIFDPEKNQNGSFKLAQLVRAAKGLKKACLALELPLISGKDSMKNDAYLEGKKISIPPTLLISAMGTTPDARLLTSLDFKKEGDSLYLIGTTSEEMGGTEFAAYLNTKGGKVPTVNLEEAFQTFQNVFEAHQKQLLNSCHDLSDGGLAVALAESAFSGGFGAEVDLEMIPSQGDLSIEAKLFSESGGRFLVSTSDPEALEHLLKVPYAKLGKVMRKTRLEVALKGQPLISEELSLLKSAWQKGGLQ